MVFQVIFSFTTHSFTHIIKRIILSSMLLPSFISRSLFRPILNLHFQIHTINSRLFSIADGKHTSNSALTLRAWWKMQKYVLRSTSKCPLQTEIRYTLRDFKYSFSFGVMRLLSRAFCIALL